MGESDKCTLTSGRFELTLSVTNCRGCWASEGEGSFKETSTRDSKVLDSTRHLARSSSGQGTVFSIPRVFVMRPSATAAVPAVPMLVEITAVLLVPKLPAVDVALAVSVVVPGEPELVPVVLETIVLVAVVPVELVLVVIVLVMVVLLQVVLVAVVLVAVVLVLAAAAAAMSA